MNPRIIDGDSAAGSSSRDIIISKLTKTANTHKFAAQPPTNMFGRTASEPADRERFYEYGSPIARTTSGEGGNTNLQRSASELEESAPLVNTPQKSPYEQTTPWFTLKNEHNHNRNRNLRQRDGDALRQTKSVPGDSFTHIESSSASEEEEIQLVKAQINANRNNRAASLLNNPPDVLYKETISCFFAYNSVHKNLTSGKKKKCVEELGYCT
jgi:hypothetical protein